MNAVSTTLVFLAALSDSSLAEVAVWDLDAHDQEQRTVLLKIVKGEVVHGVLRAESNQAAVLLAKAGYMTQLLELLADTSDYQVMQAVAHTRDPRTIPIFEDRLRREPNNRFLVGSLSNVGSPRAWPILAELLERHRDTIPPQSEDMVGCLLNAILLNRCLDAASVLRQRFLVCNAPSQVARRSDYAITLLTLGDEVGVPWLGRVLRGEVGRDGDIGHVAGRLATLCDHIKGSGLVELEDEGVLEPLLPELARGAASTGSLARDCRRVLVALTRHDLPSGNREWIEWCSRHAGRHPVYSTPLDRAAGSCVDSFVSGLRESAKTSEWLRGIERYLAHPLHRPAPRSSFLWRVEANPDFAISHQGGARPVPRSIPREELRLQLTIAMTSKLPPQEHELFRRDLESINLTLSLTSPVNDPRAKEELIALATRAAGILADYEATREQ